MLTHLESQDFFFSLVFTFLFSKAQCFQEQWVSLCMFCAIPIDDSGIVFSKSKCVHSFGRCTFAFLFSKTLASFPHTTTTQRARERVDNTEPDAACRRAALHNKRARRGEIKRTFGNRKWFILERSVPCWRKRHVRLWNKKSPAMHVETLVEKRHKRDKKTTNNKQQTTKTKIITTNSNNETAF